MTETIEIAGTIQKELLRNSRNVALLNLSNRKGFAAHDEVGEGRWGRIPWSTRARDGPGAGRECIRMIASF